MEDDMKFAIKKICLLTALLAMILTGSALADDLPGVQDVIDTFIKATGGKDAYLAHESMMVTGTFEMPVMGLTAPLVMYQAMPDLTYLKIESAAIGTIENGSIDGVFWEKSLMGGARIKDGEEKASAERTANLRLWLEWEKYYTGGEVTGIEEIEGRPCYAMTMTPKEGQPEYSWWDTETGLLVKNAAVVTNEMGDVSIDAYPSDYRDVGGVMVAHTVKQVLMGVQEMFIKTETMTWDPEIPEGTFDIPADIKALLEAK